MSDDSDFDTKNLDKLIKALSDDESMCKVGILGTHDSRNDVNSNATIGMKHEFGDDKLPIRSFLRAPISENMQSYLDNSDAFDKEAVKKVIEEKSFIPWLKKLGVLAEAIVSDAFNTGGFGKWKPSNMDFKKNHQTLVETQQLRNSITSEVQ